jgi:threonine/homoserine/homoserine lactone efflux protein
MFELGEVPSFPALLLITVVVSLSGVLMPGPVFAVTIVRGRKSKYAGAYIALGHGAVEFPLMVLIYLGFLQFFVEDTFRRGVALIGGAMLVYMGIRIMVSKENSAEKNYEAVPHGSLIAGAVTTTANPYFFLWWGTVGAALIMSASFYGFLGFAIFAFVHWLCDLLWGLAVSITVFKSKKFLRPSYHDLINLGCGGLLVAFGVWFVVAYI